VRRVSVRTILDELGIEVVREQGFWVSVGVKVVAA